MSLRPVPLILAPTAVEFRAVRKALAPLSARGELLTAQCGEGPNRASRFCQTLTPQRISCLVLIGWAGGLDSTLSAGDLVCADAALMEGRPPLPCQVLPGSRWRKGSILTVPEVLAGMAEKQSAALNGALAVEMEAYPLAEWALAAGRPFIHCRIVLDAFDETLPGLLRERADEGGKPAVRILRRAWNLVRFPALLRRIMALNPLLEALAREVSEQIPLVQI